MSHSYLAEEHSEQPIDVSGELAQQRSTVLFPSISVPNIPNHQLRPRLKMMNSIALVVDIDQKDRALIRFLEGVDISG